MHGWKTALTVPQRERVKDIFANWCSDQITSNVMLWKNVHPQWELSKINWVFRLATGNPSISLPALHVNLGWRWRLIKPLIHSHVHVIGYVPYSTICVVHIYDLTSVSGSGGDCEKAAEPVTTVRDCVTTFACCVKPQDIFKQTSEQFPALFVATKLRVFDLVRWSFPSVYHAQT